MHPCRVLPLTVLLSITMCWCTLRLSGTTPLRVLMLEEGLDCLLEQVCDQPHPVTVRAMISGALESNVSQSLEKLTTLWGQVSLLHTPPSPFSWVPALLLCLLMFLTVGLLRADESAFLETQILCHACSY